MLECFSYFYQKDKSWLLKIYEILKKENNTLKIQNPETMLSLFKIYLLLYNCYLNPNLTLKQVIQNTVNQLKILSLKYKEKNLENLLKKLFKDKPNPKCKFLKEKFLKAFDKVRKNKPQIIDDFVNGLIKDHWFLFKKISHFFFVDNQPIKKYIEQGYTKEELIEFLNNKNIIYGDYIFDLVGYMKALRDFGFKIKAIYPSSNQILYQVSYGFEINNFDDFLKKIDEVFSFLTVFNFIPMLEFYYNKNNVGGYLKQDDINFAKLKQAIENGYKGKVFASGKLFINTKN